MWVRGLKLALTQYVGEENMSHPMWVRGLKQNCSDGRCPQGVAPYVGAWIETRRMFGNDFYRQSHPMWVRGLKHWT